MLLVILTAFFVSVLGTNQVCPGGSFSCADTATCCELPNKSYGCCPLKNAVCCDDHIHCCPENNKCDAGICIQLNGANVTAKKALSAQETEISCFGSGFSCPNNMTCCKGKEAGTFGCCPRENAVCCLDGYHCCPQNTDCDEKAQRCVSKDIVFEMYDFQKNRIKVKSIKYSPLLKPNNVHSVICPDDASQCPDGYTCCKLPNGDWGCCPYPNATCCTDHLHCCPENMKCDSSSQTCSQGQLLLPALLKKLAISINAGITCPDNSTCADTMTCCELNNQHFGCCAYENAVCCEDHSHCCPSGFSCDVEQKRCVSKKKWLKYD